LAGVNIFNTYVESINKSKKLILAINEANLPYDEAVILKRYQYIN